MKEVVLSVLLFSSGFCFGWATRGTWDASKPSMPPGFVLQSDGYNYRFFWWTGDYWTTNYEGGTKDSSQAEAWKLYRFNERLHPWRNVE